LHFPARLGLQDPVGGSIPRNVFILSVSKFSIFAHKVVFGVPATPRAFEPCQSKRICHCDSIRKTNNMCFLLLFFLEKKGHDR
jgi:hypothetical protein